MSMQSSLFQEDDILEKLNRQADILGLLMTGMELINIGIESLLVKVFRKEHHAINYVIPSLIGKHGPLKDMSVRLKLLYALGFISREEYEDIELLDVLLDELIKTQKQYAFSDNEIILAIRSLHHMHLLLEPILKQDELLQSGIIDGVKSVIYQNRYQQMVRSALILALNDITLSIIDKQKIDYFPE